VAAAAHLYVGDWHKSDTGLLGQVIGYRYRPGAPLSGFWRYEGESTSSFGGREYKHSEYTDHRDLAVFLLGVVFPVVLLTMAGFVYFGGRKHLPAEARPVQKG